MEHPANDYPCWWKLFERDFNDFNPIFNNFLDSFFSLLAHLFDNVIDNPVNRKRLNIIYEKMYSDYSH